MWYTGWWQAGARRPRLTWKKLTEKDCREWKLTTVNPQDRSTWRSGVRSAQPSRQEHLEIRCEICSTLKTGAPGDQVWDLLCLQLASYLEEGPLMWMMPLHLHVNKKSDYDMMISIEISIWTSSGILYYSLKKPLEPLCKISWGIKDVNMIFLLVGHWERSFEYPQHMFLLRN